MSDVDQKLRGRDERCSYRPLIHPLAANRPASGLRLTTDADFFDADLLEFVKS
jgi:hypothetical protein